MKKKIIVLIVIFSVLAVSGFIYFFIQRNSADTVGGNLPEQFGSVDLNDPGIIQISDKYSKDQIENAVTTISKSENKTTVQKGGIESEIVDLIEQKKKETFSSVSAGLNLRKTEPKFLDVAFKIIDSQGQVVLTKTPAVKVASVSDNFVFADSVPQSMRDVFYQSYPSIEAVYGARADNIPISVRWLPNYPSGGVGGSYMGHKIEIYMAEDHSYIKPAIVHELTHAFRGDHSVPLLWEEGFAVKVEDIVSKQLGYLLTDSVNWRINAGYQYEALDTLPQNEATDYAEYYSHGSRTADKLYHYDQNFFKKFNALVKQSNPKIPLNSAKLIDFAAKSVANVDGEPTANWFSHNYFYVNLDRSSSVKSFVPMTGSDNGFILSGDEITIGLKIRPLNAGDQIKIELSDKSNNLLVGSDCFTTTSNSGSFVVQKCVNPPDSYKSYRGAIRAKIDYISSQDSASSVSNTSYLLRTDSDYSKYTLAIVSDRTNTILKITKNGGTPEFIKVEKNYLISAANPVMGEGEYKIEQYSTKSGCTNSNLEQCLGNKVAEKNFFKSHTLSMYSLIFGGITNYGVQKPTIVSTVQSFSVGLSRTVNCAHVFSLSGIPTSRIWGKTAKFTIANLTPNRRYQYKISNSWNWQQVKSVSGTAKTLAGTDLHIVEHKNGGSVLDNTFYRQVTFNKPYKQSSVKDVYINEGFTRDTTIEFVNDTTIKVKPKAHLFNNKTYAITGLENITDRNGNLLNKFNQYTHGSINLPVNPAGQSIPRYEMLTSGAISATGKIKVGVNFQPKYSFSNIYVSMSSIDAEYKTIQATAELNSAGNELSLTPSETLKSGTTYHLCVSEIIDVNNNYIRSLSTYFETSP